MDHAKFEEILSGFSVTTTTPFINDLSHVDTDAISTNIEFLVKNDVPLIIPNGNTGEFYSLSEEEWKIYYNVWSWTFNHNRSFST